MASQELSSSSTPSQQRATNITFRGQIYPSLREVATFIDTKLPLNQRYDAQVEVLNQIKIAKDILEDNLVFFFEYMQNAKSFEATSVSFQEFLSEHQDVAFRVGEIMRAKKKKNDARKTVEESWSSDRGKALVTYIIRERGLDGMQMMQSLAKLATNLESAEAISLLNVVISERIKVLTPARRALRRNKDLNTDDIRKAAKFVPLDTAIPPIDTTQLRVLGLKIGALGLLETDRSTDMMALVNVSVETATILLSAETSASSQAVPGVTNSRGTKRGRSSRGNTISDREDAPKSPAKASLASSSVDTTYLGPPKSVKYQISLLKPKLAGPEHISQLRDHGATTLPTLQWWLDDHEMRDIVYAEFAMYGHHFPNFNRKEGVLPNMKFSIAQQLARQDPALYVAHVNLREDGETRLVSHPQPAKYIEAGSKVDIISFGSGLPLLHTQDRRISDEICIDPDNKKHCLETVPGFKDHWDEWLKTAQRQINGGYVPIISTAAEAALLEQFLESKNLRWMPMKCGAGSTLLFESRMPVRLKFTAETSRRSLAVCFMGVGEEGILECGASGNEISLSHLRLEAPKTLLPSADGDFPSTFAPAVELFGLGHLSDALIGRRKWDSELVLRERDYVLGCNGIVFSNYYKIWKDQAKQAALECWELVKVREKEHYGPRSYFANPAGLIQEKASRTL